MRLGRTAARGIPVPRLQRDGYGLLGATRGLTASAESLRLLPERCRGNCPRPKGKISKKKKDYFSTSVEESPDTSVEEPNTSLKVSKGPPGPVAPSGTPESGE